MAIHFTCDQCGHPFEVDDRLAGHLGRCKYCGHTAPIPGRRVESPSGSASHPHSAPAPAIGLKLRPIEGDEADDTAADGVSPRLKIRPVPPEDVPATLGDEPDDDPDDEPAPPSRRSRSRRKNAAVPLYSVLDPDKWEQYQAQPFHLNPHYETRLARAVSRLFRGIRDWLFVISFGFLVLGLVGLAFSIRSLLHVAAVGVVATNIGMLVASGFYLVTLPFKDSLAKGLGTLLVPPYAIYYWATHWPKMRKPVMNTLKSFTPIVLIGFAYFFYVKAPAIEEGFERVEKVIEKQGEKLDRLHLPGDPLSVDPAPPPKEAAGAGAPESTEPEIPPGKMRPF